jgi:hypothetical protein
MLATGEEVRLEEEVLGRYLNHSDQGERIQQVLQTVPGEPSRAVPRTPKRAPEPIKRRGWPN